MANPFTEDDKLLPFSWHPSSPRDVAPATLDGGGANGGGFLG